MKRKRWGPGSDRILRVRSQLRVRFQEVDSLQVVWHGHYLSYFEEGRNAFGRRFEFGYQDILKAGYIAPLVHVELDYFRPARFDEVLEIETRMHMEEGAQVLFSYLITQAEKAEKEKVASGMTVQVFTDLDGQLALTRPPFFEEFLARWQAEVESS